MRQILLLLSISALTGITWIDPPNLAAQANKQESVNDTVGYQWSNAAAVAPGWRSQYPLSAQTTQGRPSFSSSTPLGINTTSGLTSNGEDLLFTEGELSRIDSKGQRLWIRTPEEKEMEFHYTSATQTLGVGASVEGLAHASRGYLRVYYTREGGRDTAVQIAVEIRGTKSSLIHRGHK